MSFFAGAGSSDAAESSVSTYQYVENSALPEWQFHWTNARRLREIGTGLERTGALPLKKIRQEQNLCVYWPSLCDLPALYLWPDAGGSLAAVPGEPYAGYGPQGEPPRVLAIQLPEKGRVLKLTTYSGGKPRTIAPAELAGVDLIHHTYMARNGQELYQEWILLNPHFPKAYTASFSEFPAFAKEQIRNAAETKPFDVPDYHYRDGPDRQYAVQAAQDYLRDPESNVPRSLMRLGRVPDFALDSVDGGVFSEFHAGIDEGESRGFLVPNEWYPEDQAKLLGVQEGDRGIHVSVGSERALLGAASNPRANALVIVDLDPEILRFHSINRFLLAVSKDRADYLALRDAATHDEWLKRLEWGPTLDGELEAWLRSPGSWTWWKERIREDLPMQQALANLHSNGSYLNSDVAFGKVRQLARSGRYGIVAGNLAEAGTQNRLARVLDRLGGHISAFDISSAWKKDYMTSDALQDLIKRMAPQIGDDGTWLLSLGGMEKGQWRYLAVSGGELKRPETARVLADQDLLRARFNDLGSNRAAGQLIRGRSVFPAEKPLMDRCQELFKSLFSLLGVAPQLRTG